MPPHLFEPGVQVAPGLLQSSREAFTLTSERLRKVATVVRSIKSSVATRHPRSAFGVFRGQSFDDAVGTLVCG